MEQTRWVCPTGRGGSPDGDHGWTGPGSASALPKQGHDLCPWAVPVTVPCRERLQICQDSSPEAQPSSALQGSDANAGLRSPGLALAQLLLMSLSISVPHVQVGKPPLSQADALSVLCHDMSLLCAEGTAVGPRPC